MLPVSDEPPTARPSKRLPTTETISGHRLSPDDDSIGVYTRHAATRSEWISIELTVEDLPERLYAPEHHFKRGLRIRELDTDWVYTQR